MNLYYSILQSLGRIVKFYLRNSFTAGKNFELYLGGGIVGNKDTIVIGNNVRLFGWLISDGGKIIVGNHTVIHKDTVVRSMNLLEIGKYCDIGNGVYIQDHNSMSLNYLERRTCSGKVISEPVKIGDDVWIGRRAMIMKGVTIGDRAIIGAGAVITHNVPSDSIMAGNPAKIVKYLGPKTNEQQQGI